MSQSADALVGLHACTNFVKANKNDFEAALKRLGSINKMKASIKTALIAQSYESAYKQGVLPDFYVQDKARLAQEKENARAQAELERTHNENK